MLLTTLVTFHGYVYPKKKIFLLVFKQNTRSQAGIHTNLFIFLRRGNKYICPLRFTFLVSSWFRPLAAQPVLCGCKSLFQGYRAVKGTVPPGTEPLVLVSFLDSFCKKSYEDSFVHILTRSKAFYLSRGLLAKKMILLSVFSFVFHTSLPAPASHSGCCTPHEYAFLTLLLHFPLSFGSIHLPHTTSRL